MRFDPDDMPEGICDRCGDFVTATVVDEGIGPYEFWGDKGVHHDYVTCSPCCNAEVVPGGTKILSRGTRRARKEHLDSERRPIHKGETYRFVVRRNWRKDGPSWYVTEKYRAR